MSRRRSCLCVATLGALALLASSAVAETFDDPRFSSELVTTVAPFGPVGVAWAPDRGISKVEVQIGEDAPWVEAELSSPLSDDSWVQWMVPWDPPLGTTFIQVRATDGDGNTQTEERAEPAPSGATGWDRHAVTIDPA